MLGHIIVHSTTINQAKSWYQEFETLYNLQSSIWKLFYFDILYTYYNTILIVKIHLSQEIEFF